MKIKTTKGSKSNIFKREKYFAKVEIFYLIKLTKSVRGDFLFRVQGRRNYRKKVKGYSLVELAISLAIFMVVAAAVTLAIGNAGINGGQIRLEKAVRLELTSLVNQVVSGPYAGIVENTFTRPSACAVDERSSCVSVNGRSFTVSWSTTAGNDPYGLSTLAPISMSVSASVTLPNGTIITSTGTALEPNGGWEDGSYTALRVDVQNPSGYQGPLYLYSDKAGVAKVISASAPLGSSSVAILRYNSAQCASCRVALSPTGSNVVGNYLLDSAATSNYGYTITANSGLTDTSVVIRTRATLTMDLWAVNSDGTVGVPPASSGGSICLYLNYQEGGIPYQVPGCNTVGDPSQIIYNTFTAASSVSNGSFTSGIPVGVPLTFSTDGVPFGSGCQNPSTGSVSGITTTYATGSGNFAAGYECTSWTWGYPTYLNTTSNTYQTSGSTFENGTLTLPTTSVIPEYGITWAGNTPASGSNSGDPVWVKARTKRASPTSLSTSAMLTSDTSCSAAKYCNSSALFFPYPSSGRFSTPLGSQYAIVYNGSGAFSLSLNDPDFVSSSPITISMSGSTNNNFLYTSSNKNSADKVSNNQVLNSSCTSLPCTTNLWYGGSGTDNFVLELTKGGTSAYYNIGLAPSTSSLWGVVSNNIYLNLPQGGTNTYLLSAYNFGGNLVGGASLNTTGAGLTYTAPATTASTPVSASGNCPAVGIGQACVQVSASSTTSATNYSITSSLTSGLYSAQVTATVTQTPANLSVLSSTNGSQGGSNSIKILVKDGTGTAVPNAAVYLTSVYNTSGNWTSGVIPSTISCTTDSNGNCTISLSFESSAPAGSYSYTLVSGSLSAVGSFTITPTLAQITSNAISLPQGSSATIPIYFLDGSGNGVNNITPTLSSLTGLTENFAGKTNAQGLVNLTLTAASNLALGQHFLTLSSGSITSKLRLTIVGVPTQLSYPTATLAEGNSLSLPVTLKDSNGAPVAYAAISITTTSGLIIPSIAHSDGSGVVSLIISAPLSLATGSFTLAVTGSNGSLGSIPISVTAGASSLMAENSLALGASGTLILTMRDNSGNPVTGISASITSPTTNIILTTAVAGTLTTTSDTSGNLNIPVRIGSSVVPGIYNLNVMINGNIITVPVLVGS